MFLRSAVGIDSGEDYVRETTKKAKKTLEAKKEGEIAPEGRSHKVTVTS
jgi:hypothetical protein